MAGRRPGGLAGGDGALSLKGALERPALYGIVVVGYIAAFTCLSVLLGRGMPLGVVYGVWGALGVVLTAGLSAVLFDERLNGVTIAGVTLIIAGVLAVELGSHTAESASDREAQLGGAER
jgi:small multidrug resistance pump